MRILLVSLLMAATALAGCSDEGPTAPVDDDDQKFDDVDLDKDKGVIRGIVIDPAIVPVQNAVVKLGGSDKETLTNGDGAFLFANIEPGTYFVSVSKLGYVASQTSTEVVAGVEKPAILKVQLVPDPTSQPTVDYFQFDGYIECTFALVAVGFNACGFVADVGEVDLGESQVRYDFKSEAPTWIQTEMVWQSSQPLGDSLALLYSYGECDAGFYCDHEAEGPSTLVLSANETVAKTLFDEEGQLYIRVFGTETQNAPGTNLGATLEQDFTHFTSVFYGFKPQEGWLYTVDGPHPLPA